MSEIERDAFAAIVRQLEPTTRSTHERAPEPVPPTWCATSRRSTRSSRSTGDDSANTSEELARRYGEGPTLRRDRAARRRRTAEHLQLDCSRSAADATKRHARSRNGCGRLPRPPRAGSAPAQASRSDSRQGSRTDRAACTRSSIATGCGSAAAATRSSTRTKPRSLRDPRLPVRRRCPFCGGSDLAPGIPPTSRSSSTAPRQAHTRKEAERVQEVRELAARRPRKRVIMRRKCRTRPWSTTRAGGPECDIRRRSAPTGSVAT